MARQQILLRVEAAGCSPLTARPRSSPAAPRCTAGAPAIAPPVAAARPDAVLHRGSLLAFVQISAEHLAPRVLVRLCRACSCLIAYLLAQPSLVRHQHSQAKSRLSVSVRRLGVVTHAYIHVLVDQTVSHGKSGRYTSGALGHQIEGWQEPLLLLFGCYWCQAD